MPHFLFERDDLNYKFVKEVNANPDSEDFDQRALEQDGTHHDHGMNNVVVVADSKEDAVAKLEHPQDS